MDNPPHNCPGGCGAQVGFDMFACKEDWFRLPEALRKAINCAAARAKQYPGAHRAAILAGHRWFRTHPRVSETRAAPGRHQAGQP